MSGIEWLKASWRHHASPPTQRAIPLLVFSVVMAGSGIALLSGRAPAKKATPALQPPPQAAAAPAAVERRASLLARGDASFHKGEFREAIAAYERYAATASSPAEKALGLSSSARVRRAQGDLGSAADLASAAARLDPQYLPLERAIAADINQLARARQASASVAANGGGGPVESGQGAQASGAGTASASMAATAADAPSRPTRRPRRVRADALTHVPPGPEDTPPPPH